MRTFGFATRNVTDNIIRPFVVKCPNGVWHEKVQQVEPLLKTKWLSFGMKEREEWYRDKNDIVVCGILRGTERLIQDAEFHKINYYYFDHAYFYRASAHKYHPVLKERFYRIVVNGQHLTTTTKLEQSDYDRIAKLQHQLPLDIRRRQEQGKYILICPPTPWVCNFYGLGNPASWLKEKTEMLMKNTDKELVIRTKNSKKTLEEDLDNAWAVVTCQSTVAIEAIMRGIPSFCDDMSCAVPLSELDLTQIERPKRPSDMEIENWRNSLLANQFGMKEIADGKTYSIVNRLQKGRFYASEG
jgi:hypothetical protein|tara:strand:- start:1422 stop:2318 length:897 start_codon:yes stop_codon:yes gene_type:complete